MPGMTNWAPSSPRQNILARSKLLASIRTFFHDRGVIEVETPLLSRAGNSDPGIRQFSVKESSLWLRTSPEYAMKRMLAAGSGDIFELGRVFREGENGRNHNHEFTMLEWYRVDWTYQQLMDEVEELVRYCASSLSSKFTRVSYRDLVLSFTSIDPLKASDQQLKEFIRSKDIVLEGLDRNAMLDLIISHFVQPDLPEDSLTFVFDYPAAQAALARIRNDAEPVAERFELFLGKQELANGYQELTDPVEQQSRFEQENEARIRQGESAVQLDREFLAALASGMPECSGVALGVDRLLMALLGAQSLQEVLAFPSERA